MENQENLLFISISVYVRAVTLALLTFFSILAQTNIDFEAKIKEALYIKNIG